MIESIEAHALLWEHIKQLLAKNRLPQALLFVGPRHAGILSFANRLMAILLCQNQETPCGHCPACHLLLHGIHPDINYIRQEKLGGAIKIEQVRELQQTIYQTPQQGSRRFIVIDPADKMNISAANALLKILEEPPKHTFFILIAEQIDSIPATILSRCQKYMFSVPASITNEEDYLTIGKFYPTDSSRAEIIKQRTTIVTALCDLIEGKSSPCTLAIQWSTYVFDDLLWLLYLITAQAINYQLIDQLIDTNNVSPGSEKLIQFSRLLHSVRLFNQLDQINAITRKINHNINMNQTLVLEDLLLGYTFHR
jgi:DNA polymerase-3 subunit delta'